MQKEYVNCKNFDTIYCPEKNEEMMKELISKTTLRPDMLTDITEGLMIGHKVNELICSKCKSFKEISFKR